MKALQIISRILLMAALVSLAAWCFSSLPDWVRTDSWRSGAGNPVYVGL